MKKIILIAILGFGMVSCSAQENHFITDALFTLVGIGVVGIIAFFGNMGTL